MTARIYRVLEVFTDLVYPNLLWMVSRYSHDARVLLPLQRKNLTDPSWWVSYGPGPGRCSPRTSCWSDRWSPSGAPCTYPATVRQTRGLVHLKTAGTSYLEALRTVAALDAELFREIYAFALDRYEEDRASYHVSASLEKAPASGSVTDQDLSALLDRFDEREILHVTFGSVLTREVLRDRFMDALVAHPEDYAHNLQKHFVRHLEPFAAARSDENGGSE